MQRLQTVTDSVRIFGKRHQADARLGGRQWLKCQLFDLQQTLVSQLLWLAPRTPASVPRDWLKSTHTCPTPRSKAARPRAVTYRVSRLRSGRSWPPAVGHDQTLTSMIGLPNS